MKKIFPLVLSLFVFVLILLPNFALAQTGFVPCDGTAVNGGTACTECHLVQMGSRVLSWLIGILFLLFAFMLFAAGWGLITSGGNSSAREAAKSKLVNALIGILIVLAAWLIVDTLMRALLSGGNGQITGWGPWQQVQCGSMSAVNFAAYHANSVTLAPTACDPSVAPPAPNSCAGIAASCTAQSGCTASTTQTSATQGSVACTCQGGVTATGTCGCNTAGMQTISLFGFATIVDPSLVPRLQAVEAAWNSHGGHSYYRVRTVASIRSCVILSSGRASAHSSGLAVDINADTNPHCKRNPTAASPDYDPLRLCTTPRPSLITDMNNVNPPFQSLFTSQGFGWGGNWSSSKDAMHFSAISGEGGWMSCP